MRFLISLLALICFGTGLATAQAPMSIDAQDWHYCGRFYTNIPNCPNDPNEAPQPTATRDPELYKCGGLPSLFNGVAKLSLRLNYMTGYEIITANEKTVTEMHAALSRPDWVEPGAANRKCQFQTYIHHAMVEISIIRTMQGRGYSDQQIKYSLRGTEW